MVEQLGHVPGCAEPGKTASLRFKMTRQLLVLGYTHNKQRYRSRVVSEINRLRYLYFPFGAPTALAAEAAGAQWESRNRGYDELTKVA